MRAFIDPAPTHKTPSFRLFGKVVTKTFFGRVRIKAFGNAHSLSPFTACHASRPFPQCLQCQSLLMNMGRMVITQSQIAQRRRRGLPMVSVDGLDFRDGALRIASRPGRQIRTSIKEVVCHLDISVLGRVYKPPPPHDFHWRKKDLYLSLPRLFKLIR